MNVTMKIPTLAMAAVVTIALAGCSAATPAEDDGSVRIVASTSVYGSLAQSIVGDLATVTSLIDDPGVDPHSFEASARDQLAISEADLVIENGGGYDPFIDSLLEASGSGALVVSAVDASGLLEGAGEHDESEEGHEDHGHIEGFNEHVWYSLHGMTHLVEEIVGHLGELDPANAPAYEANGAALSAAIEALDDRAHALDAGGAQVAVTEPVPVYLLAEAGLVDATSTEFTEAIEEGNDVPPLAMQETLDLLASGDVVLLAYNSQTASPETERVREAAEAADVVVVEFTETLPDGADYVSWMTENLDALEAALAP